MTKESGGVWVSLTILFIVLFIASIVTGIFLYNSKDVEKQCPIIEEKALLDVQIYDWAINELDESEMFFDYWIYNYGNVEAKNVKVRCDLIEEDLETKRTSVLHSSGNLASLSESFEEVILDIPEINEDEEFVGLCHVESCDNCEILYKKIPELVKNYEGY